MKHSENRIFALFGPERITHSVHNSHLYSKKCTETRKGRKFWSNFL